MKPAERHSPPTAAGGFIGGVATVLLAPTGPDRAVATAYAKALKWNVVGVVADPAAAAARITSRTASTVMTTVEALRGLGPGAARLLDQVEAAGGELHAGPVREPKPGIGGPHATA